MLHVEPLDDGSIGLIVTSQAPQCRFTDAVFEVPIQVNETGFQLKHALRSSQDRDTDGCTEAMATAYVPEHYWPLKAATSVTLHLPWGPLPLSDVALAYLKTITPSRPAYKAPTDSNQYITVVNRLTTMVAAGQVGEARKAAETLLPIFVDRPPQEAFPFFSLLGNARRATRDLSAAASSFEVAIMLAAMTKSSPAIGVVYDNLATVRRLQKRWPEAEAASDRAIATFEAADDPQMRQSLAGGYSNRALIFFDQEQYERALEYSERALTIFRVTLRDNPKALEAFLADNRVIREKLGRK